MNKMVGAVLAAALIFSTAEAMPLTALPKQGATVLPVAEGCGAGFHRVAGRCVRTAAPRVVAPHVVVRPAIVRPWAHRSYFGTVVAGITLGALIAATAPPPPPGPDLCWYWSSPAMNQGYWDYC
jgi:hypothetical protein